MPVQRGAHNVKVGGLTDASVLVPNDVVPGDWLIVAGMGQSGQTLSPPAGQGWTSLFARTVTGTRATQAFAKQRKRDDPDVYAFTYDVNGAHRVVITSVRDAVDIAQWIIGTPCPRGTTGTSLTNVATGIAVPNNTTVITISTEATNAVEAAPPVPTNATEWFYEAIHPLNSQIETVGLYYNDVALASTTSSVTITYPNSQTSNGFAIQIGIPLGTVGPGYPVGRVNNLGEAQNAFLAVFNGTDAVPAEYVERMPVGLKVADLLATPGFIMAHRGFGSNRPEETMRAFTDAVHIGAKCLDCDINYSSDLVPVLHHDADTSRMTGQNFTIATTPWATLEPLLNTSALTINPAQPSAPMGRLEQLLAAYGGTHTISVEIKVASASHINRLLDLLERYISNAQAWCIIELPRAAQTAAAAAKARGYVTSGIYFDAEIDDVATTGQVFTMIGLNWDATVAQWSAAVATGKTVWGHVISSQAQATQATSRGANGLKVSRWPLP